MIVWSETQDGICYAMRIIDAMRSERKDNDAEIDAGARVLFWVVPLRSSRLDDDRDHLACGEGVWLMLQYRKQVAEDCRVGRDGDV